MLSGCATRHVYVPTPACELPRLEGGKEPTYRDLYEYSQRTQEAIKKCNTERGIADG